MSAVTSALPRINTPGSRTGGKARSGVRRGSRPAAAAKGFFRPMAVDEATRIMKVARHYSETHRKKGVAPLTAGTLRVLETFLFKALDWTTGKLDWSYLQLAEKAGRSVDTVWRAILQLEAGGWLERMRRCEPNLDAGPGDPPFRQITNAYRLMLPEPVRRWWQSIGIKNRRAPVSADIEHDQAVRAGEKSLMEPQNHQLVGERERDRRNAQREAQQASWVQQHRPQPSSPPAPTQGSQQATSARIWAKIHADERRRLADSEEQ